MYFRNSFANSFAQPSHAGGANTSFEPVMLGQVSVSPDQGTSIHRCHSQPYNIPEVRYSGPLANQLCISFIPHSSLAASVVPTLRGAAACCFSSCCILQPLSLPG